MANGSKRALLPSRVFPDGLYRKAFGSDTAPSDGRYNSKKTPTSWVTSTSRYLVWSSELIMWDPSKGCFILWTESEESQSLWGFEDDSILVVDIPLLELCEFFPNPFLILVKLEEPHVDVALLHPLNQDDHLLLPLNAAGKSTDPANLQLSGGGVLEVVDGVAEDHGAEGAIDAVVHPKRLDPQHHRVQLVSHLFPQLVCLCLVFDNIEDCAFEILNFAIFR